MNPNSFKDLFFRNGHLLGLTIAVVVLAGISALVNLPRIEDPRIATRNALVITEFPGASAERVESLVTKKLEEELREVEEIKNIDSTSRANISLISIELQDYIDGSTNEQAFSRVRDRLGDAQSLLPLGAGKPQFDDERGASAFALVVGLSVTNDDESKIGLVGRLGDELADRFRNLAGAERVRVYGNPAEEITITLDAGELAAQGLTAQQVATLVAQSDPKNPAGALRDSQRDLFIEVAGEFDSLATIRNLVLVEGAQGQLLRLGDVATVSRGWKKPTDTEGYVNGRRTVFVATSAEPDVRIDKWQESANAVLQDFQAQIDSGIAVDVVFQQSLYAAERLVSLSNNLLLGALVIMLVVLVGLGWRAALIVGAALPLSALATLFGLTFFDQQIHQMSMFGMIIAIGLLIDNAIVVTDEIQKRLQNGVERRVAVAGAVTHLSAPLFASTVTTVLGFMPIFLLSGNIGDFIGPIAISVVLALISSFMISMTVIAALGGRLLPQSKDHSKNHSENHSHSTPWWHAGIQVPALTRMSERFFKLAFARPAFTVLLALVLPLLGFFAATKLSLEFFPPAERDQFEIEVWMSDEASLERTKDLANGIESAVGEYEGIQQLSWLVGGSHPQFYYNRIMKQDSNAAYAHAMVQTDTAERAENLVVELQQRLDRQFPEAQIIVAPFAQGPPVDAPLGFRIEGPSLPVLIEKGAELRRIMHDVPAITHTRASLNTRAKLAFEAEQFAAQSVGLSLTGVAQQLQGNLEGITGGSILEDLEQLPVRVRYDQSARQSMSEIASMPLLTPGSSEWVPADTLGPMALVPEGASITRRNGQRVNTIHGWVAPGELPIAAAEQVTSLLAAQEFELPPGYSLAMDGESDAQRQAVGSLTTYLPVLIMLMVATLVLSFKSVRASAIILSVAILSAGLGMLALWFSGFNLGFNPLLGSAGLIGVAINGAIVVLAALRADPGAQSGDVEAVVAVTLKEARHILATTATTIGGFLPLLVISGGEFWPPLAVVIAGGVGFSVILSLLFTPAVFTLMVQRRSRTRTRLGAIGALGILGASGCAVGPDYQPPQPIAQAEWVDEQETVAEGLDGWWRHFDDPAIIGLVDRALESNLDLKVAVSRLRQARALQSQSRAGLLPQVDLQSSYTRFRLSEGSNQVLASGGQFPRSGELFDSGFDAAWELDFFGGNRRRLEASKARTEAAAAELANVRLSLIAEVVRVVAELRGAQRRLSVARENVALQEEVLSLVQKRVNSGLSAELDGINAAAQVAGTRANIPTLEAEVKVATYRLATLLGQEPNQVATQLQNHGIPKHSLSLKPGLRSEVIRRRPDLKVAERQVAAASAEIGVAVADLFPRLVLNAQYGWQAQNGDGLFSSATEQLGFVPSLRLPISMLGGCGPKSPTILHAMSKPCFSIKTKCCGPSKNLRVP